MDNSLTRLLQNILATVEKKYPYTTATVFDTRGIEINLDKENERISSRHGNRGIVLSIFNGRYFEEYATDMIDEKHIEEFCHRAFDRVVAEEIKYELTQPREGNRSFRTAEKIDPDSMSIENKLDILRQRRAALLLGKNMVNCTISYTEETAHKTFITRKGTLDERMRRISHYMVAYVSNGKDLKYDFFSTGGTGGLEIIDIPDGTIPSLIESANRLFSSENIEPGFYDVIGTPEIAGLIAHEAFGHGVETDMYLKDRARSKDYLGEIIASPVVNIIDDPSLPGGYGSYFVDDEGNIAQPTYIVKEGRFIQGLTNRYSSSVLKLNPTANGRRESFARKIYARMSNTFFEPGTRTPEEIISSVDNGIYLIKGLSGMEDPKGWGIQVLALYGKEIRKGRLTDRIFSPLGITGYVPDLLKSISMVGNDFKVDVGTCGKGHKEYVPVSSGGPHIRTRLRLG